MNRLGGSSSFKIKQNLNTGKHGDFYSCNLLLKNLYSLDYDGCLYITHYVALLEDVENVISFIRHIPDIPGLNEGVEEDEEDDERDPGYIKEEANQISSLSSNCSSIEEAL